MAVVGFFDALTMERCYRPARADNGALKMLKAQRGLAFDPHIVDTFVAHADELIALRDRINDECLDCTKLSGAIDPLLSPQAAPAAAAARNAAEGTESTS